MTEVKNTHDLCRTCLKRDEKMISVFSSENTVFNELLVSEILKECASIQITSDDLLPKRICNDCMQKAKQCYQFKQDCQKSEEILLKLTKKHETVNENCLNTEVIIKNEVEYSSDHKELWTADTYEDYTGCILSNSVDDDASNSDKSIEAVGTIEFDTYFNTKNQENKIDSNVYTCPFCNKSFKRKFNFERHAKNTHTEEWHEYITKIRKEKKEIVNKQLDTLNVSSDMDSIKFSNESKEQLTDLSKLSEDIKASSENGSKTACTICSKIFKNNYYFKIHMRHHLGFDCLHCKRKFSTKSNMNRHTRTYHVDEINSKEEEASFVCIICKKEFKSKKYYIKHIELHRNVTYECNFCSQIFDSNRALQSHKRIHGGKNGFLCNYCKHEFNNKEELDKHMNTHKNQTIFTCNICGKQFSRNKNLMIHLKMHSAEKSHLCSVCGIGFKLKNNLNAHMRLHTGEKPYSCEFCENRRFAQWSSLRHHMITHSNERKYVCQICGKAFKRSSPLSLHMRTHTGQDDRKYVCPMCPKKFRTSTIRNRHLVIHTGEKNFTCTTCGKSFNRSSTLTVHNRIHTGERPFVCSVCGRGFIQRVVLETHMKSHQ